MEIHSKVKSKDNAHGDTKFKDSRVFSLQSVLKALKHIVYIDSENKSLSVPEIAL